MSLIELEEVPMPERLPHPRADLQRELWVAQRQALLMLNEHLEHADLPEETRNVFRQAFLLMVGRIETVYAIKRNTSKGR